MPDETKETFADADPGEPESVLCPKCLLSNEPWVDFCANCGAPLGMMATIDPLKQTLAEGFAYRQAIDGPPSRIIVLGIWMVFLPGLLTLPITVAQGGRDAEALAMPALYFLLSAVIIWQVTANFIRKRRAS
jgi:hypothetical protein